MATLYRLHPDNPQSRTIDQIVAELRNGAVMLYPTDTVYAIGCDLNSKSAIQRVRQLKQLANDKPLTFLCSSLSNIAHYAVVSDRAYRIMRSLIPGSYTFLLPATKLVPKLVMSPKRRTTGIRVPDHPVCQALLKAIDNPIISTSAHIPVEDETVPLKVRDPENLSLPELFDSMDRLVDVIVDTGQEPTQLVSTILDLTNDEPEIVRKGLGWETAADWVLE
ncbi:MULTISPECIES: L-threonylcarbamoyladenylate synthase [Leptolyngbya]|uniref:L-threonylcarbamoyladenylate synthase n=1 Tax=Leptolyngbya boryana CZ1 TaxID=3060204 RepID=A0AA97AS36_LEPBY|nr:MULTISPECIES: L-threonylcarbamoyladenylate synthase [Leptolyngbya]MBD1856377.1 threonylcarbamoyl-AMP synthase [Leptolyngbya sp. FACHB-1624]MBN8559382.1 threonylcarbamoyl-AMP synthase [Leptolyngbya sp. UWPOB_LEPTO1]MCY6489378.1 L-threonylcarbamoyladenylate synthase [Leptolyngbya sp. GGD]WNZ48037.1 L-threonylcarbamoyladenylate synthase [Leptolyngbya boryana CZ1]